MWSLQRKYPHLEDLEHFWHRHTRAERPWPAATTQYDVRFCSSGRRTFQSLAFSAWPERPQRPQRPLFGQQLLHWADTGSFLAWLWADSPSRPTPRLLQDELDGRLVLNARKPVPCLVGARQLLSSANGPRSRDGRWATGDGSDPSETEDSVPPFERCQGFGLAPVVRESAAEIIAAATDFPCPTGETLPLALSLSARTPRWWRFSSPHTKYTTVVYLGHCLR